MSRYKITPSDEGNWWVYRDYDTYTRWLVLYEDKEEAQKYVDCLNDRIEGNQ